jgi:glycine/D-amino acid oxidase-like deaminating enzyme
VTSLWRATAPPFTRRPALRGELSVDVAIVGGGYTGLWTAYYLLAADPTLRVAVLEAEHAGYGASGRNGGWCSALYPVSLSALGAEYGRDAAIGQYRAMIGAVDEVERVVAAEAIDCDWARGGTVVLARSGAQLSRARAEVDERESYGFDDLRLLDRAATTARLNAADALGATYTPHCAALQPWKLARGLADAVETRGGLLFEGTRVTSIEPGRLTTKQGAVSASSIVRATEGYTSQLPGEQRRLVPIYSLMISTSPLSESIWNEIGLAARETFADERHLIIYGQRTADDRMVLGGRGAPYHFGSRIRDSYDSVPAVFAGLRTALGELFPVLRNVEVTHSWGGPLGISRDWHPAVGWQPSTGIGYAGGYVGDGVSTTNLAGRTLTALILGNSDELIRLPWVGHTWPQWEREPLRWLGANAALRAMQWADAAEARGRRESRLAKVVNRALNR